MKFLFFSKISIVRIYYVNHNDFGTVVKLIDCIFRKNSDKLDPVIALEQPFNEVAGIMLHI